MGWIFYLTVITPLEAHWSPQAKENSYDWKVIQHAHMLIGWLEFSFPKLYSSFTSSVTLGCSFSAMRE